MPGFGVRFGLSPSGRAAVDPLVGLTAPGSLWGAWDARNTSGAVASVAALTGNGRDLAQATPADRPTGFADGLQFGGTKRLSLASPWTSPAYTGGNDRDFTMGFSGTFESGPWWLFSGGSRSCGVPYSDGNHYVLDDGSNVVASANPSAGVRRVIYVRTGESCYVYIDGVRVVNGSQLAGVVNLGHIGARTGDVADAGGGNRWAKGAVYNPGVALTAGGIAALDTWLTP